MTANAPSSAAEVVADPAAFLRALRADIPDFDYRAAAALVNVLAEEERKRDMQMSDVISGGEEIINHSLAETLAKVSPETAVFLAVATAEGFCEEGALSTSATHHWNIPDKWSPDDVAAVIAGLIDDVAKVQRWDSGRFADQVREHVAIIKDCDEVRAD